MKCPYCGKEEFVTGKQGTAYAGIAVSLLKERAVYHEICVSCGTILFDPMGRILKSSVKPIKREQCSHNKTGQAGGR